MSEFCSTLGKRYQYFSYHLQAKSLICCKNTQRNWFLVEATVPTLQDFPFALSLSHNIAHSEVSYFHFTLHIGTPNGRSKKFWGFSYEPILWILWYIIPFHSVWYLYVKEGQLPLKPKKFKKLKFYLCNEISFHLCQTNKQTKNKNKKQKTVIWKPTQRV